eukprot:CAMPEP_0173444424 /NCGR_PEP_ID=MMETSP1357-20121228/32161_1 /TAXON_ID=77926 /ORGANISM="Hemiselmis rufescens, Strain PCC563" /LENGTH=639 /DNA_ID=CAMNT_0014410469 /DNA_START=26 /DNA_END=1945 /DNA_ORIENTATION=+
MAPPELIPQSVLFGNPDKAEPKISPDGTRYAYLSSSDKGVLNVFVVPVSGGEGKMVTNDTHRGIRMFDWALDNVHLLYKQDVGGDENFHLHAVNLSTDVVRDLTPFEGCRCDALMMSKEVPGSLLVGLNVRDKSVFDMHRVDLKEGTAVVDTENPGDVAQWIVDHEFRIRGCMATVQADGSKVLRVRDTAESEWRKIAEWPHDESGGVHRFTRDGTGLFVETSIAHGKGENSDTTRLIVMSASDGTETELIATDPRCDVDDVEFDDDDDTVEAVSFDYDRKQWKAVSPAVAKDYEVLGREIKGTMTLTSKSSDNKRWIVSDFSDVKSPRYCLYDRTTSSVSLLFLARPKLEAYTLAPMSSHIITVSDNEKMVAYLTLPPGTEPKSLPLVLVVHGGPWARDHWGWNPQAQWLANRGYAVLMVNFRASTGFGKRWLHLGDAQWGETMQQDLTDAVAWAAKEGYADASRAAIFGGSYGGYATLAGLAFTPEVYCCGVDIVGPAHLRTLLQSVPAYWAPMKKMLTLRVGDVENDDALNQKASPFYHAKKVVKPLLIAQGANDPRVKQAESDQMVQAMHSVGTKVEYVLYADEGHGFARPCNRVDFYQRAEVFLAQHCKGRVGPAEPDQTEGHSASVIDPASLK